MPITRHLGEVSVTALADGIGPFFQPRQQAFPGATAAHWRAADTLDPGSVTGEDEWLLRFGCVLIRLGDGRTVLVDAGVGPAGSPAASWAPVPGRLPDAITAAGSHPDQVQTVVLTHLHTDHIGWAVTAGQPYFRNARYLLQRAEHDAIDAANPALRERLLAPLQATGQLALADGDEQLAGPVRLVATPGHTPGHQSVLVDTGDELVAVTGDLLVHAVQLVDPALRYALEVDPTAARDSRTALLDRVAARGGVLATSHLAEPFLLATAAGWVPAR